MIAWTLLAVFATTTVLLGVFIRQQGQILAAMRKDYEARLEQFRKDAEAMRATAFEARAITLVDPDRPAQKQVAAPQSISTKIRERMAELAEKDRQKALQQEAELAAQVEGRK